MVICSFILPVILCIGLYSSSARNERSSMVEMVGEMKQWHKTTLILDGPFATETDTNPNPFTDYRMEVLFVHESGSPAYRVPGYFSVDGRAGNSGSISGNKWMAHFSPDKTGKWNYKVSFWEGPMVAVSELNGAKELEPYHGLNGIFLIEKTDKSGRDFRGKGRLEYVGGHHLQFRETREYFLKTGTDSPETLLAYKDFDGTIAMKPNVPLKAYKGHIKDWRDGDVTWQGHKGKGLIGALNYLSGKGLNAVSFLTYNAGGDGDNVWPFVERNSKFHYDCSKLDQWQLVFDHAQKMGLYLHFKLQETENDDNGQKDGSLVNTNTSLDGGELGPERRLYLREMIARFSYLLALNWNLGEENTQTATQQQDMASYISHLDPYDHHIVIHTYPDQQDSVYPSLLGNQSTLTGVSLQNIWDSTHIKTLKWVEASQSSGKPWVVASDEQNPANKGVPPDPGYPGFDPGSVDYDIHDIRKQTLWGNIMAGGGGVEYYFGYQLPQNDLVAEDFRSRDRSWDYCRIALEFFRENHIPFWELENQNNLIGNHDNNQDKYCLGKKGGMYILYLAYASGTEVDLSGDTGVFHIYWYNPRTGGSLMKGSISQVDGGQSVDIGQPPKDQDQDWVIWLRKGE